MNRVDSPRHPAGAKPLLKRSGLRFAVIVVFGLLLVALMADMLASDKPLVARVDGQLYLLPNVSRPAPLRPYDTAQLVEAMQAGDWLIATPIPWGPNQQDKATQPLAPPSRRHWLGTDTARRDIASRLIHGTRVSLTVGLASAFIFVLLGTMLGALSGYAGGWIDAAVSRLTEAVMSIPVFFLVLAAMAVFEGSGLGSVIWVIGLLYWTHVARLVRAEVLRVRDLGFVEAARALGFNAPRIILRHILPHAMGPVLVATTFGVAGAILLEAGLSFLGFGAPDGVPSWGGVMRAAMGNLRAWWLIAFPGACIFVTVMAFNLIGESLRDHLDPRGDRIGKLFGSGAPDIFYRRERSYRRAAGNPG